MDRLPIKYPIYIISKGRWENGITYKYFIKENIPFTIAVEPQEYNKYAEYVDPKYLAVLPFSNLGLGSYPARNWCWDDSIRRGHKKHFIFDDNIYGFYHLLKGKRVRCTSYEALKACENFSEKYLNLAIIGYNYSMFITKETNTAFYLNTHVYSGMLIRNDIPFRWRLKYNEDVDLCLQVLNKKWCTIALNIYNIKKVSTTSKMKGGNQTELYKNNDFNKKMLKSKSLQMIWPQYVKIKFRFGRPHHQVSWNKYFKHPLLRKIETGV